MAWIDRWTLSIFYKIEKKTLEWLIKTQENIKLGVWFFFFQNNWY